MRRYTVLSIAAAAVLASGILATEDAAKQAAPAEKKAQTECPVMGGKINKSLFIDFEGKRIYVCCGGCIDKVKADPAKYIKELESKGIILDQIPKEKGPAEKK